VATRVLKPARAFGILIALSLGCDAATTNPARQAPDDAPNVIVIVVDTLRADHLSQYGYTRDTSSALSLLTDRATRFDEALSPAVWTAPAVASLFSGLSPARHNVDRVGAVLSDEIETLAETLRGAGWETAAFSFNPHVSRKARFDQGFAEFVGYRGSTKRAPDVRAMTREAWEWIEEDATAPFFLYLQPMNVHGPYRVPDDARELLLGRAPAEGFEFFGPLMKELMNKKRLERRDDVTEAFLTSLHENYDTAIRHTAEELGKLFEKLDRAGLFDDALIVLTADHGEELFDHGGFAHRYSLYREILHVPLFIKLPGQREAASIGEPVSLTDVHPTLLEVLGIEQAAKARAGADGVSLAPFLEADASPPEALRDRALVSVATNRKRCVGRSLQQGRYALLEIERSYQHDRPTTELYDLLLDPHQTRDLSHSKPDLRAAMRLALSERYAAEAQHALERRVYPLSVDDRAALEALGYTEGPNAP
jgi:arylsulfatase A-like enzyme